MASLVLAILLIFFLFGGQGADRGGISSKVGLPLVMGVLSKADASGSLEYWGRCDSGPGKRFDFPKIRSGQKVGDDPVAALSEIFADDPEMRVTRDADGFIRMVETDVPKDLLEVRISHISFKQESYPPEDVRYDPRDALWVILSTPEVAAFMKTHEIGRPSVFENANGRRARPSPLIPHLPTDLNNVTLSQALDNMLQTFPGLWIYENCPSKNSKRVVDFGVYTSSPMWSAPAGRQGQ